MVNGKSKLQNKLEKDTPVSFANWPRYLHSTPPPGPLQRTVKTQISTILDILDNVLATFDFHYSTDTVTFNRLA